MSYRVWILFHLLGVTLFFSNFVAALFWKQRADRRRDPRVVAHTFHTLVASDLWITPFAVIVIVASGVGAAIQAGLPLLGTGWILWSIAAFILSGLFAVLGAFPLQRSIAGWADAARGNSDDFDWPRYERESRRWAHWAHASLLAAGIAMVLMVLRPDLPAL